MFYQIQATQSYKLCNTAQNCNCFKVEAVRPGDRGRQSFCWIHLARLTSGGAQKLYQSIHFINGANLNQNFSFTFIIISLYAISLSNSSCVQKLCVLNFYANYFSCAHYSDDCPLYRLSKKSPNLGFKFWPKKKWIRRNLKHWQPCFRPSCLPFWSKLVRNDWAMAVV